MSTDNMFDILMEIRTVDKKIFESKVELQKSQENFINLEKNLIHTKELQTKATKVYYEMQKKEEIVKLELKEAHKNYDATLKILKDHMEIDYCSNKEEILLKIEEHKKHRDFLKQKLVTVESERDKLLGKLSDIEVQINIQKKKNAATHIRLQKCLQELMLDEKKLEEELKSISKN